MRRTRIFIDQPLALKDECVLDTRASHYLFKVLRAKVGDEVVLFNGLGGEFTATILELDKRSARLSLHEFEPNNRASTLQVSLGVALLRGDRLDYSLQKSTELGASKIALLQTERTEYPLAKNKLDKRMRHWQGVIHSACEQCGLNLPPQLSAPQSLQSWATNEHSDAKLMLMPGAPVSLANVTATQSISIAIGPEGGFSAEEEKLLNDEHFKAVSLGPRVLRTETSPAAALAILQSRFGDLAG